MSLKNSILAGTLLALSGCADEETPANHDGGAAEFTPVERDCNEVSAEAARRIQTILDAYTCRIYSDGDNIIYYPDQKTEGYQAPADYSDLSSFQGPSGDCSTEIRKYSAQIKEARAACDEHAEIVNRPQTVPVGIAR